MKINFMPRHSNKSYKKNRKRKGYPKKITKKRGWKKTVPTLHKPPKNPIIVPIKEHGWESRQTFNPAVLFEDGKARLLYRAIGEDGVSRLGYAGSYDGINIDERLKEPVFTYSSSAPDYLKAQPYRAFEYVSGGSWAGCEDPRLTRIRDTIYMLFVSFDGWNIPRLAITSIGLEDFLKKRWKWGGVKIISPPGIIDKSGCLFPEKIKGKYVILHRIFPNILIDFVDDLDFKEGQYLKGEYSIKVRKNYWDSRKIGAGAPPIKTKYGWLLIYYGVDNRDPSKYKIGAMLLDLENPVKALYRTDEPILEPIEWYEQEGHKAGIVYPCGAVVIKSKLFVFYGGADTVVCVATANLEEFLQALMHTKKPKLKPVKK
ncbi:glycosidase [bacterium (Candidatus Gribaldobacteria) CG_4_8_14_3_um_filter_42_11]|uniref:Glycosidase n=1 Tax=bacterium (Candidatus Gribaldobacteria) CG_4_8_14_3_um_filter_42_11 TaxID=2014267 RepID=A0A2M7IYY3_9BACT|nr:MAG: glycosidase [Parcubacteria group bacterium CG11_big_fil_rev_8_21_14_0_20_39_14]PIX03360.1 MAG: glycosidase [bacterium (Candidatus Gribaldobacteria) CG_4_8_14_3_um_filter_42_11]